MINKSGKGSSDHLLHIETQLSASATSYQLFLRLFQLCFACDRTNAIFVRLQLPQKASADNRGDVERIREVKGRLGVQPLSPEFYRLYHKHVSVFLVPFVVDTKIFIQIGMLSL